VKIYGHLESIVFQQPSGTGCLVILDSLCNQRLFSAYHLHASPQSVTSTLDCMICLNNRLGCIVVASLGLNDVLR
jgi:hypothetical protein